MAHLVWRDKQRWRTNERVVRSVKGIKLVLFKYATESLARAEAEMAPRHARNSLSRDPGELPSRLFVTQGVVDSYVTLEKVKPGARNAAAAIEKATGVLHHATRCTDFGRG